MSLRVATYARYSSDQQRAASIADQQRSCQHFCDSHGWAVVAQYSDAELSGDSLIRRQGIQALFEVARRGDVDIVLAESLDRLSRDIEDTAGLFKRLTFAGVRVVTVAEGDITTLHVGFKGTMNAMYLQDLRQKTHRGLRGRVAAGKAAGGICYGYRVVRALEGQPRGDREIDERQAAIVRRIFDEYSRGESPKAIARRLNADGVAGPTSAAWSPSTIHGHQARGTGILNNELYVGRMVWNRLRYLKDPSTGRRISRLNPAADVVTQDVPHLRIIDDDVWQAVKALQVVTRRKVAAGGLVRARRPDYLFSGMVRCAECGGGFTLITRGAMSCFNARSRGTCSNRRQLYRFDVEQRVLKAMTERFLEPKAFAAFCRGYADVMEAQRKDLVAASAGLRRELAGVERGIRGVIEAVKGGYSTKSMLDELVTLEARKEQLAAAIAVPAPAALHPSMADVFRQKVTALRGALESGEQPEDAKGMLRGLVEKILVPAEGLLDVEGNLGAMLELAAGRKLPPLTNNGVSYVGCGGAQPTWLTSLRVFAA